MSNFAKINTHLMDALDRLSNAKHEQVIEHEVEKTKAIVEIVKVQVQMANTMIKATEVANEYGLKGGSNQVLGVEHEG